LFKRSNLLVRGELGLDLLKSTRFAMEGFLEFVTKIVNMLKEIAGQLLISNQFVHLLLNFVSESFLTVCINQKHSRYLL
jgi:hypothetical protein